MSDKTTKRMLAAYQQSAMPVLRFLSGFFRSPMENFYNSERVEIDIEREDEDIAIVITNLATGARVNSADIYTNKSFKAPVFKESAAINAYDMINRMAGSTPFENPNFQANAMMQSFSLMRKMENKIARAIELQAAQVLTTGTLVLNDENGNPLYQLDFKPKATHFPTTGTPWTGGAGDPIGDLLALSNVIRNDGLIDTSDLVFGEGSFEAFITNSNVQTRLDNRRYELGNVRGPEVRGNGGQFRGTVSIGNYNFNMWTYGARYKDPATGNKIKYIPDDKVVMFNPESRFDATFGAIPRIAPIESRALPFLPSRVSRVDGGTDMFPNAWLTPDGEQLMVGIGSRPLMIPTAIDQYGCLDTGI